MMVLLASVFPAAAGASSQGTAASATPFAAWENGPPSDPSYFPIAVWLQQPRLAPKYKAAGINLYVGLWKGPTEKQLATLRKAGMPVICAQNEVGLAHRDDPTIVGWMHGDEPDNAQRRPDGKGYGPPVPPSKIVADYRRIRRADPTRPVLLNLGQGVAWDGWHGRGVRTNHPEDYPLYVRGADVVSFDIYPVNHSKPAVREKLWYVARGVERLVGWTGGRKIVWNCLECTRIRAPRRPTPHEVRAEAWMALVHGSRGLIWFVHQWEPRFNSHALLDDKEMLAAVTKINRRIRELAPVLNGPAADAAVEVTSGDPEVPVRVTSRRHGGHLYVFAVAMRERKADATFRVRGVPRSASVEVLYENRRIPIRDGRFADAFAPWGVHIYRIARAEAED
jgi:hypothetical protein